MNNLTVVLLFALIFAERVHSSSHLCPATGDGESNKKIRMNALRANILAQLGLTEVPVIRNKTTPSPELMDAYRAITEAERARIRAKQASAQPDRNILALRVNTFTGNFTSNPVPTNNGKRSVAISGNELAVYNLTFNVSLPEELKEVKSAELLLYQVPLQDNGYTINYKQYIELRCVHDGGTKTVVGSTYTNTYDSGFKVFDIISAMNDWKEEDSNGPLRMELAVYCIESASCASGGSDQSKPEPVKFFNHTESHKHNPRIVVKSKNPLETPESSRSRRQSGSGVSFCVSGQTTCCLNPLIIHFANDLDMGFITEPVDFEANYCDGVCPITPGGELMTPTLFSYLSQLTGTPAASVEPCCAGVEYSDLTVMVEVAEGMILIDTLSQVKADSCRCG